MRASLEGRWDTAKHALSEFPVQEVLAATFESRKKSQRVVDSCDLYVFRQQKKTVKGQVDVSRFRVML